MALPVPRKTYTPAPEGVKNAVIVDVVDLGERDTTFGPKPCVRLVWEIPDTMEDGRRFTVSKWYTLSLDKKSNLYRDLKGIKGRDLTKDELDKLSADLEVAVGAPCQIVIQHTEKDGSIYGNVVTVLKADPANITTISGGYVKVKERKDDRKIQPVAEQQQEETGCPF